MDWEQRYTSSSQLFGDKPSELLVSELHRIQQGSTVLAIGDGEGRNGVWLAQQGLSVYSIDISPTALNRARIRAKQLGVALETLCIDLFEWTWPVNRFDIITCIFVHFPPGLRAQLYQNSFQALKPGGLLIIEGFHADQQRLDSGGPADPDLLLNEDLLHHAFPTAECLRMDRVTTRVMLNGNDQGEGAAIQFVARKPESA